VRARWLWLPLLVGLLALSACSGEHTLSDEIEAWAAQIRDSQWGGKSELGTAGNPVKMFFTPSAEADRIILSAEDVAHALEKLTGLKILVRVPTSYAVLIQALGADAADVAWIAPFAYVRAHELNGALPLLRIVRYGSDVYYGQFLVRADSDLQRLEDIAGRRIGYTDAASTTGHIFPKAMLIKRGIAPAQEVFLGGHPQAVLAVRDGKVDVACTWHSPVRDGQIQDARKLVLATFPHIVDEVRILARTEPIPNDLVAVRATLPAPIRERVKDGLLRYVATPEGREALETLYGVTALAPTVDADYEVIREAVRLAPELAKQLLE